MLGLGGLLWLAATALVALVFTSPDELLADDLIPDETIVVILLLPLSVFAYRRYSMVHHRLRAAEITAEQFPDLHSMLLRACATAGLHTPPSAFISLEVPVEPCRTDHAKRNDLLIGTDFYAGCRENDQPAAMEFMVAHELGHHLARHGSFGRQLLSALITPIPGIGRLLTRAQEYTADRFAHLHCPQGGPAALALTMSGKDNFVYVLPDKLVEDAQSGHGFYLWLNNALDGVPMPSWRAHALADDSDPGRLLWHPRGG